MSNMVSVDSEELEKMRELIQSLTAQNNTLTKENSNLKERLNTKDTVSKAIFFITIPESDSLQEDIATKSTMMRGVEVKMFANYLLNNDSVRQLYFELESPAKYNAAFMSRITYASTYNILLYFGCFHYETVHFEYMQLEGGGIARSALILAKKVVSRGSQMILNVHTRLIRNIHESIITFTGEDKMANVKIEEEIIPVNISYISAWSEFFFGYFASKMKESIDELYPIEECDAYEFREMLDVIYPSCKPISIWNLTRKCEIFLCDRSKHNFTDSELLKLTDDYRLAFMKTIILECTTGDQLLKNVIAKEKYKSYSEELKKAIDKRYVESKVPERNKC
ncbi:hypothetical protein PRIPAC_85573 [Pristionchus pacificus]|uniref:BTB domain-containing protein n=1 Tax=Pristionchus pacificus TaxID=54126 RepID=A0A2A6BRV1_PRIPA|nr:hypothetical protein PRIPAC_85573 [Pristionchus pacificus]|eukprot:PDM68659.1 BTB domain-containing protein [Pristionchus pacificus]